MSAETISETQLPSGDIKNVDIHINIIEYPQLSNAFQNIISRKEATELVEKSFSSNFKLVDYQLRPYSEEKLGFLGSHLCLIVAAKTASGQVDRKSFFVKTLPYDVPTQAAYIKEKGCFRKEAGFFKFLLPMLMENFKGESWAPKCYLVKDNLLIFEDMKARGFTTKSRELDERSLRAAIACIARFHASSLLAEERQSGKTIQDLYPEIVEETEFKRTGRSFTWYKVAMDLVVSLANDLGLDSSRIYKASSRLFDICIPSQTKRNVVSHGDLWSSNMIFDIEDRCNLLDFQLIRYAPLAHDVMQLLYLTTSREFRERCTLAMLSYYYKVLERTLENNDYKNEIPSYAEVLQSAEEQKFAALVTAAIFHPTVMMDGKTAAMIMDNPDTYEAYYFQNRRPFVDKIMAEDEDYERKIKGIVSELVEMSLIVESLPRPT